ncbi:MAG TPA: siphovirus Gp157 family protein [Devosia sp.]|jgi:hypothetical protein|nr:siphovirus Gp157 family protein [Devosia sp.]
MSYVDVALKREVEAGRRLLMGLKDLGMEDDSILCQDTIEGETGLLEAITQALGEIDECTMMITGIREHESWLASRRERLAQRKENLNALIEQAMLSTDLMSMRLPTATLSLVRRARPLQLDCEADIPSRFWVLPDPPAPRLDKKALLAELNEARPVPGASLGDATYSLTVRRK